MLVAASKQKKNHEYGSFICFVVESDNLITTHKNCRRNFCGEEKPFEKVNSLLRINVRERALTSCCIHKLMMSAFLFDLARESVAFINIFYVAKRNVFCYNNTYLTS